MTLPESDEIMLETLLSYNKIALDPSSQQAILKDTTVIQFLIYSLDSVNFEVVKLALQTLSLLAENTRNHNVLKSSFGIIEALKSTSERDDLDPNLKMLAQEVNNNLENDSPQRVTQSLSDNILRSEKSNLGSNMYTFQVFGLNEDTRIDMQNTLIRIKGVISVVVSVEHQRCIVRAVETVEPKFLAENIMAKTNLVAHLVVRNNKNQEVLKDLLDNCEFQTDKNIDELPPYLEEEDPPVEEKAILTFDRLKSSASSWIRTATTFLHESLYW